jgi:lipoprotein-anchoring transpeptidase ErfK/SrfK
MSGELRIEIDIATQSLVLLEDGETRRRYRVSTALRGAGEDEGSERTPRGLHLVRAKIGAGLPRGAVLSGRRPTGEIWSPELQARHPSRDWILTRILWLSGMERGRNRLGSVDTMRRFIYIHGSPDPVPMGRPGSHGCIRMRNDDILELFDAVPVGTRVHIADGTQE